MSSVCTLPRPEPSRDRPPATPTAVPGVLYIEETATIIGGTGRFAGATGSFFSERLYDRVAGTTIGTFEGTISSPGR